MPTITIVLRTRHFTGQSPAYAVIFCADGVKSELMAYRRRQARPRAENKIGAVCMKYIYRAILILVLLGFVALSGYAYLGDLSPMQTQVNVPVKINVD